MVNKLKIGGILTLSVLGLAFGLRNFIPILDFCSISFAIISIGYLITWIKPKPEEKTIKIGHNNLLPEEVEEVLKSNDAIFEEYHAKFEEHEDIINTQKEVIEEYEGIFDKMAVELPCICGGNTFSGLFSPNTDNEVECEKCHNKYRVEISYNTVLISEPLDLEQPMEKIIPNIN